MPPGRGRSASTGAPPAGAASAVGVVGAVAVSGADALIAALDAGRARWLRGLAPLLGPRLGLLMRRPDLRVAIGGVFGVLGALLCALLLPLWTLALAPLFLGVPHLLADLRYLVVRPGLHKRARLLLGVGLPLLVTGLGAGMPAGLGAVLATLFLVPGAAWRRVLGALLVVPLLVWGCFRGFYEQELILAHGHNLVAVVLWWLWRPRRGALHALPVALFVLAGAALLVGAARPIAGALDWGGPVALSLEAHADALAPMFEPALATRLVLLFCFAQGVHYSLWLRLIPEDDRDRLAPRSFRGSLTALRAELGAPILVGASLAMLVLLAWAVRDLCAARVGYFRLALFHGYLELCALAMFWVRGAGPQPARG